MERRLNAERQSVTDFLSVPDIKRAKLRFVIVSLLSSDDDNALYDGQSPEEVTYCIYKYKKSVKTVFSVH